MNKQRLAFDTNARAIHEMFKFLNIFSTISVAASRTKSAQTMDDFFFLILVKWNASSCTGSYIKKNIIKNTFLICPLRNSSLLFHFKCCLLFCRRCRRNAEFYIEKCDVHTKCAVSKKPNSRTWTTTLTIWLGWLFFVLFKYHCVCMFLFFSFHSSLLEIILR